MIEKFTGCALPFPSMRPQPGVGLSITRRCDFCPRVTTGLGGGSIPAGKAGSKGQIKLFACSNCKPVELAKIEARRTAKLAKSKALNSSQPEIADSDKLPPAPAAENPIIARQDKPKKVSTYRSSRPEHLVQDNLPNHLFGPIRSV